MYLIGASREYEPSHCCDVLVGIGVADNYECGKKGVKEGQSY